MHSLLRAAIEICPDPDHLFSGRKENRRNSVWWEGVATARKRAGSRSWSGGGSSLVGGSGRPVVVRAKETVSNERGD
jgi:hypothetical protein